MEFSKLKCLVFVSVLVWDEKLKLGRNEITDDAHFSMGAPRFKVWEKHLQGGCPEVVGRLLSETDVT